MSNVPAATRTLLVMRALAGAPGPLTAAGLARDLGLPRSSVYHLLSAMEAEGFVVHYPEDERWGLGLAAFEIGTAYLRQEPLERLARPLLAGLAQRASQTAPCVAHVGVLHGRETLYLALHELATSPVTVVADVGVRLPASLTASGRALLAALPAAQVRALFPSRDAFVDRTGRGPTTPRSLTALLRTESARGWAEEDGFITDGFASVAAAALDRNERPVASIGLTFRSPLFPHGGTLSTHRGSFSTPSTDAEARQVLAELVRTYARELSRRLR
ncbi:MAG: IclR family transcriptional regulator [Actinomycetes bacterium]